MKTTRLLLAALLLLPCLARAQSQVPGLISYQGIVTDTAGVLVGNAAPVNREVFFRIWDSSTASDVGNLVYSERQVVTISKGEFSVLIGQGAVVTGTPLGYSETGKGPPTVTVATAFAASGRYLGVTVDDGTAAADVEITPRQQMVSTAFTIRARQAEALTSGTITGGTITGAVTATDSTFTGGVFNAGTFAGTGSGLTALNASNISTGTLADARLSGNVSLLGSSIESAEITNGTITTADLADASVTKAKLGADVGVWDNASGNAYRSTGNVGIGFSTAPAAKLEVRGPAASTLLRLQPTSDNWFVSEMVDFAGTQRFYTGIAKNSSDFVWGTGPGDAAMGVSGAKKLFISAIGVAGQPVESVGIVMHGNNVGIGTTSPASKLSVNCITNQVGENNASFASPNIGTGVCFIHYGTLGDVYFRSANTSTGKVIIQDQGGNVGVGTTSPTQAKLVVNGFVSHQPNSTASNFILNSGQTPNTVVTAQNNSIYTSTTIWSGGWVVVSSDGRIKTITGISNSQKDLDMLRGIEITDYFYKDKITKGGAAQKKVIAQQVEKVFPQAVSKQTDVLPDIFQTGDFKDGWVTLKTDLKKGERVRLTDDKTTDVFEVLEVRPGKFRTAFKPEGDKVFVYGREVKDFRTVDYDAISMLNVSATQELARKVEALEKANAEKDTALTAMTQRLAALEARDKARDAKLAAIESMLSGDKPAALPVSLRKSVGGAE
ncbi:MAG: tail fiber domain-containing protein [Prosthecobacter sp.]|jgi:hypothetical protein|uniref:tail fiber domain-containing protein n=1 Tax=Prosthecobacter sp. TaxID=1965333 RepID=UPI001A057AF7|nr:tail fiber domain-containing protein [Prosthecobacter sp.]MBE2284928.1 tail fiber domain-containing protein [Prosthecobacter sp.]